VSATGAVGGLQDFANSVADFFAGEWFFAQPT
jgi:hypothetical protein